ncbi:hypothetical protein V5264_32405, partial [Pseudomonas citronellolis]
VYPGEVERALRSVEGVQNAFVTDVDGQVGAAVLGAGLDARQLRDAAREVLSAFKIPTVWLLVASDDDVPRGGTGKVDIPRLRELLKAQGTRVQG